MISMRFILLVQLLLVVLGLSQAHARTAFVSYNHHQSSSRKNDAPVRLHESTNQEQAATESDAIKFLSSKFPDFSRLLMKPSKEATKFLTDDTKKCTVFAPNASVFQNLPEKRLAQIQDPRNLETVEKMAAYHIIPDECISWNQLLQEDWTVPKVDGKPQLSIGGVKTLGGEVRVGRSKSGGFLGLGAKEDGGVAVGSDAKIIQSFTVGDSCIVHEVDAFVFPELLWRYCDQLRIPGF